MRELRFSDVVLRLLTSTSDLGVRRAALLFLRPALDDNVDSVEAFGRVRGGEGLSHILRIASDLVAAPDDEEELMAVCHIICVLCHVRANFDRLVCRGLTNALVKLVPHLSFSATSATIALELLDRCVAASEREAKKAFAEPAATGVISCIQTNRHNASVQEAGMMLLMSVIDMFDLNREIACKAKAPQVVHFALTEHAKDARVVAAACRVLIRFSAFDILSAELGINELIMLLRSRLKMHRSDGDTSIALLELIEALELVPPRTVELIRTFREQNTSESSMSRHSDMNSQTLGPRTMSGSLRKSFHRRLRHGSGKWLERGRRVHSDFGVEDSFQRARRDDVQGHPKHSGQSFRMRRKSKGYERTSGERLFRRLSGLSKSSEPGEDGRKEATEPTSGGYHLALKASEPLIRLLTNSREDVSGRDYRVRRPMVPMVQKELGSACAFRHERQLSLLERKTLPNERPMQISAFDNNNIGPVVIEKKGNGVVDNGLSYTEAKEYWKPLGRSGDEKRHSTWCHSWKVEDVLPSPVLSFNAVESGHEESDEDSLEDHSCFSLSDSETGSRNGALDNGEDRASIGVNEDAEGDVFGGDCYDAPPELDDDVIKQRKVKKASSDARTKVTKEIESVESCSPCTNSGSGDMDMRSEDEAEFGEEQFPNLTPGPLYSENVMRIGADCDTPIHMDSGFDHNDLLSRAKIFGERERKPESLARISGAWGRPNWSIWPFNSAEDPVELRSFPARFHPRGESGSLRMRR